MVCFLCVQEVKFPCLDTLIQTRVLTNQGTRSILAIL